MIQSWEQTRDEYRYESLKQDAQSPGIVAAPGILQAYNRAIESYNDPNSRLLIQQGFREIFVRYDGTHRNIIEQALAENKPVPFAVLADYPDLKAFKE